MERTLRRSSKSWLISQHFINLRFTISCIGCANATYGILLATPTEINIDEEADDDAVAEETPKRSNLIVTGVASLVVAGVAAGAAFMLAPAPSSDTEHAENQTDAQASESPAAGHKPAKHGEKKNNKHGKLQPQLFDGGELKLYGDSAFFVLDPLVISIRPIANTKHLRISLVLETSVEEASALLSRIFHVRDILNTYLRSVDREAFENPAAMERLRTQIRRRIHAIAPDVTVDNVLITEFILT